MGLRVPKTVEKTTRTTKSAEFGHINQAKQKDNNLRHFLYSSGPCDATHPFNHVVQDKRLHML